MTNELFERVYYVKYASVIRAIARKLAKKNDPLMDDLFQEGLIALWKCEPTTARDNEDAFIRQAVKFRMIDYMRRERPALYESLNVKMEHGGQIVYDASAGEARMVDERQTRRRHDTTYDFDTDARGHRKEVDGPDEVEEE